MKKRKLVEGDGIAMLLDLDDCTGCYNCEAACRDVNRYPYGEDWMKVVRQEPLMIDGKLRQYHLVAPLLDKCRSCYDNDPDPKCVRSCTGKALKIGTLQEMVREAEGRHCAIYTS